MRLVFLVVGLHFPVLWHCVCRRADQTQRPVPFRRRYAGRRDWRAGPSGRQDAESRCARCPRNVFRNAYCFGSNVPAVCSPSRNMLLSGRVSFASRARRRRISPTWPRRSRPRAMRPTITASAATPPFNFRRSSITTSISRTIRPNGARARRARDRRCGDRVSQGAKDG